MLVAAVHNRASVQLFRLRDGRRERLAMVMAVGEYAEFQWLVPDGDICAVSFS